MLARFSSRFRRKAAPIERGPVAYRLFLKESTAATHSPSPYGVTLFGLVDYIFSIAPDLRAIAIGENLGLVSILSFDQRISDEARRAIDLFRPVGMLIEYNPR